MIHPQRGNAGDGGAADDVGRIEPTAQADLDDRRRGGRAGEGEEGGGGRDLEETGADAVRMIEHFGQQRGERCVVDQLARDPDAFVEPHQMRAGEDVDVMPRRLDRSAQEGAGGAFAVGAGDVKHRRQRVLRVAEPIEQSRDPLQTQHVGPGRQCPEPVELCLHGGIGRDGVIRHGGAPLRLVGVRRRGRPSDSRSPSRAGRADPSGERPCRACRDPADIRRAGILRAAFRGSYSRSRAGRRNR